MAQAQKGITGMSWGEVIHDWGIWIFAFVTASATGASAFYAWLTNRPEIEIDAQRTELGAAGTIQFHCQLDASNPSAQSMIIEKIGALFPKHATIANEDFEQDRSGQPVGLPGEFSHRRISVDCEVKARNRGTLHFYISVPEGQEPTRFKFEVMWRKKSRSIRQRRWIRYARIRD
jgi:hypothetical protein